MTLADSSAKVRPDLSDADVAAKIVRQAHEAAQTKEEFFAQQAQKIAACCRAMAARIDQGATVYCFGNGGSFSDALHMAVEFTHPIFEKRPALPAVCLGTDSAHLTAVGNDQDFSLAFAQQLRIFAKRGDIAMGFSTSGKSANVTRGLQAAREMGLLTIGYAGKDGGRLPAACDHCFVVPSFSIPRIQETQETLLHIMWDMIHVLRGEEDVL